MPTQEEKEQDEILVRDMKAGHMEAFDKIFELYQRRIYALAFNMTRNQMDAQDVTQEVLLTIYRKIGTFQGKSAFSSWVYRVTLNATYMKLRTKKKEQYVSLDEACPISTMPDSKTKRFPIGRKVRIRCCFRTKPRE